MEIIHKERTGSTNDDAADLGRRGYPHLTAVVADFQEQGRGRRGHRWSAPAGHHLLFSVLLRPAEAPDKWRRIPQIAGMELIHSVENLFSPNDGIKLKWPNDLYYCAKKWAGILVESSVGAEPFAVLGIGVNCREGRDSFPAELASRITTLEEIYGESAFDRLELLRSFLDRFSRSLPQFLEDFEPVVAFANRRDYLEGKKVVVDADSSRLRGTACGIGRGGELLLRTSSGKVESIVAGSITEILG